MTSPTFSCACKKSLARSKREATRARQPRPRAFTLIEILIVIAIIALLAAILFPVFARVRENARRSSCASNLKQLALGMIQYAQDYDEQLPVDKPYDSSLPASYRTMMFSIPAKTPRFTSCTTTSSACVTWFWADLIYPYVKNAQVYNDPADGNKYFEGCLEPDGSACSPPAAALGRSKSWVYQGPWDSMLNIAPYSGTPPVTQSARDGLAYGYLYPNYSTVPNPRPGTQLATVVYPSEKGLLAEGWTYWISNYDRMMTRHFNGVNVAFVDGHVKWVSWAKIEDKNDAGLSEAGKHFWFYNGETGE